MINSNPVYYSLPIMRINAHLSSAILPTDKYGFAAMLPNMKKINDKSELIAAQKEEIHSICYNYGINTTAVAKKAELVPSTINRFMNTKDPKNALSSITMSKIRSRWPMASQTPQTNQNGFDAGIMGAISVIFAILTARSLIKDEDLAVLLHHQIKSFQVQNQPGAIEVMETLLSSLGLKPHESRIQAIRKLLPPAPAESP